MPSAFVSIRQHTPSACVGGWHAALSVPIYALCIHQHVSAYAVSIRRRWHAALSVCLYMLSAHISICQNVSAYVSIRNHMSAYVSFRQHTSTYVSIRRENKREYVSIRERTSADAKKGGQWVPLYIVPIYIYIYIYIYIL